MLKLEISRPVAGDVSLGNERDPIFVPARSQMAVLTQEAEAGSGIERRARRGETTLRRGKHRGDDRLGFGPFQNPFARNGQEQYRPSTRHAPELFLRNLCAVALVTVFSRALPCFRIRSLPRLAGATFLRTYMSWHPNQKASE
jgi:hypothetical protein